MRNPIFYAPGGLVVLLLFLCRAGAAQDITVAILKTIRFASQFPGRDCGAKIMAADADLGNSAGEIWVDQTCGTQWSTPVNLSSNRTLRFSQGGTYQATAGSITQMLSAQGTSTVHKTNVHIIGDGIGSTYLQAPSNGGQLGAVIQFFYCDDCGAQDLTADGNSNTTVVLVDEMDSRLSIRNIRLLGDTSFVPTRNYCAHVRGSQYGNYDTVYLVGGSQDALLVGLGPFGNPTHAAQWNHFSNIVATQSPWNGIDLGGTSSLVVQNNSFSNITVLGNGTYTGGNDDRYGLNLNFASYNQFLGLKAWNNQWSGIRINGGTGNMFVGIDSQQNGQAGNNSGDAIRLEFGLSSNPNYGNVFVGEAHSRGKNYAINTSGANTSFNSFSVEIGSSPISVSGNNILHLGRTVAGMESVSGLDFSVMGLANCPSAPGIANVTHVGICLAGNIRVNGDLTVDGAIYKQADHFRIDHPLDPEHKYLSHSVVESPDMMNIYSGTAVLDGRGQVWVTLPDYFEALNRDFRYQLTPLGAPAPALHVARKISANRFKIAGGMPHGEVSWQVTGIRHDAYANAHQVRVEEQKTSSDLRTKGHP
jgi:hypothetical protein